MGKLNNIVNNTFDILISLVGIGVDKGKEELELVRKTCDTDRIWNGGVTNLKGSRIDEEMDEPPYTPNDTMDDFEFVEMHGPSTIIYDGLYNDREDDERDRDRGEITK